MAKLTDKQEKFCLEYMVDLNATQAAIRAGYSQKTAQQTGSRMLLNVVIQERIQELRKKLNEPIEQKYVISRERVLDKLCIHAFANMTIPDENEKDYDKKNYALAVYNSVSRNQLKSLEIINSMMGYDKPEVQKKKKIDVNINFTESPELSDIAEFKELLDNENTE